MTSLRSIVCRKTQVKGRSVKTRHRRRKSKIISNDDDCRFKNKTNMVLIFFFLALNHLRLQANIAVLCFDSTRQATINQFKLVSSTFSKGESPPGKTSGWHFSMRAPLRTQECHADDSTRGKIRLKGEMQNSNLLMPGAARCSSLLTLVRAPRSAVTNEDAWA